MPELLRAAAPAVRRPFSRLLAGLRDGSRLCAVAAALLGGGLVVAPAARAADASSLSARLPDAAQVARGRQLAQACIGCHGADGNASGPTFPKLAGQSAAYLERELEHFRVEAPAQHPLRPSAIMNPIAQSLSAQQRRDLAAYFSSCELKPALAPASSDLTRGAHIWRGGIRDRQVPACAACHGADGHGIPPLYPSLAGQWAQYLTAQLEAFRDGTRNDHGPMHEISSRMTESQIRDVADFVAGLR